jgi:hypothetical protein
MLMRVKLMSASDARRDLISSRSHAVMLDARHVVRHAFCHLGSSRFVESQLGDTVRNQTVTRRLILRIYPYRTA